MKFKWISELKFIDFALLNIGKRIEPKLIEAKMTSQKSC